MDANSPAAWLIPQNRISQNFVPRERPNDILSEEDDRLLQSKLYRFLSIHVERYTQGDSSSVRIEVAEELLRSVCFTLRLCLAKGRANIQDLVCADDLKPFWNMGCAIIEREFTHGRVLLMQAEQSSPPIENTSYRDTLAGLAEFFRKYDRLFFAHQIPGDIDYQLYAPVPEDYAGIEYVNEYLQHLLLENTFLSRFDPNELISLLERYSPYYKGLLINLYEPAAINAIGRALLGQSAQMLRFPLDGAWDLAALLAGRSAESRTKLLARAAQKVCLDIGCTDTQTKKYVNKTAMDLLPRIENALVHGSLQNIFLC